MGGLSTQGGSMWILHLPWGCPFIFISRSATLQRKSSRGDCVRELLYSPFPYSAIYIILAFLFESWYFGHLPRSICLVTCVTLLMVTSSLVTCHCHMITQAYHYGCASIWLSSASWSVWLTASWWYDSARLCSYQYISRATLYIR